MLTFLKVIGTILLVILLVILVLLLLVLFVPFRYNVEFEYDKDKLNLKARVTWLLIFRFYLKFVEKKLAYKFKILFFPILNSEKAAKNKKSQVEDEFINKESNQRTDIKSSDEVMEEQQEVIHDTVTEKDNDSLQETDTDNSKKKFSFKLLHPAEIYYIISHKIIDIFWKIRSAILNAERKFDKICEMIADTDNKEAVIFILSQIKTLVRHVLPTKHGIYLKAGFDNPATTGQLLGAYSVVNSIFKLNFILEPDFDHNIIETKGFVRGRIRVINLLMIGIKVITNKTIRKFIRRK